MKLPMICMSFVVGQTRALILWLLYSTISLSTVAISPYVYLYQDTSHSLTVDLAPMSVNSQSHLDTDNNTPCGIFQGKKLILSFQLSI
jgi:hypothetical protein